MMKGVAGPEQQPEKNKPGENPAAWTSPGSHDSRHNEDATKTVTSGATVTPTYSQCLHAIPPAAFISLNFLPLLAS